MSYQMLKKCTHKRKKKSIMRRLSRNTMPPYVFINVNVFKRPSVCKCIQKTKCV